MCPSLPPSLSTESQAKRDGVGGGGGGGKGGKGASPRTSGTGGGAGPEDTARRHIASELLQTEKNFVDILTIIVKVGGATCTCICMYICTGIHVCTCTLCKVEAPLTRVKDKIRSTKNHQNLYVVIII